MIRFDKGHSFANEAQADRDDAIAELQDLLEKGFTHVAFDPSDGVVGAHAHEVIPNAAFTDFIEIRGDNALNDNALNEDAINFVLSVYAQH